MEVYSTFYVRIAGITVGICTKYPVIKKWMGGYIMEDAAEPDAYGDTAEVIRISDAEREETKKRLREAKLNGNIRAAKLNNIPTDTLVGCLPEPSAEISDANAEMQAIHARIAEYFLDHDRMLMHGSAISMDGECYIFTAPSGTGKSTHARLWREAFGERAFMVNDDKPMLICNEDGIFACGTPWCGKHRLGTNTQVRVKAIAILRRAGENSAEQVKPEKIFEFLFTQMYIPETREGTVKALELMARISRNVKFYVLHCNMEPGAASAAYEAMN